jgi:hypothetical protein
MQPKDGEWSGLPAGTAQTVEGPGDHRSPGWPLEGIEDGERGLRRGQILMVFLVTFFI